MMWPMTLYDMFDVLFLIFKAQFNAVHKIAINSVP